MSELFDEKKLRSEIVSKWGPAGAHVDLYDTILSALAQVRGELAKEKRLREEDVKTLCDERDQAMAELEAVKKERDLWYSQRNEAIEGAQALKKRAEYLQAKLAAAEKERDYQMGLAQDAYSKTLEMDRLRREAESQAAELMRALVKVSNDLSVSVNLHAKEAQRNASLGAGYPQGPCQCDDCNLWRFVRETISNLPASVQARAEREAALDAVVEKGNRLRVLSKNLDAFDCGHESEERCNCGNIHGQMLSEYKVAEEEFFAALARLAALDSAQKGEKR